MKVLQISDGYACLSFTYHTFYDANSGICKDFEGTGDAGSKGSFHSSPIAVIGPVRTLFPPCSERKLQVRGCVVALK